MSPVFRILGPITVLEEGREIPIGAPRLRTLLAALLVNANQTVSAAELIQWLWDGEPPAQPQRALQTAVSRLRGVIGPGLDLRHHAGGYRLEVPAGGLDLCQFRLLTAAGTADALAEALRLWQGEPLTGAHDYAVVRDKRAVLQEEWLRAAEQLVDARLALREYAELIPELTSLTKRFPLRERFWAQLMLALHNSSRQAEALAAYEELASLLRDELGIDPGEEVRRLHLEVLNGPDATWQVHRQLPADIGDFVGRQDEVKAIVAHLTEAAVPVVTISGPPGVGKTALAVRVAHLVKDRYPDGQWFLRDADTTPPPPDKRVLIVLDDVEELGWVPVGNSAVLVTSRSDLALEGAYGTTLAVLEPAEAIELLRAVLGAERADREPQATADIADLCGYLPLALRIAAGHLALRPAEQLAAYADHLRGNNRLLALALLGDHDAAVEAAWSPW
ncbi:AfsR/SARP family transcriptional regulator [Kribbella monticola]|uniref:AfsR/SARP family transcriptional regulator n=1 Tax=Kribbella monticola TaxID=2185285 RepID=UPI000DD2D4B8|nr:AfsR/SARP family transcriptional regulator [Kribbella monticola]